MTLYAFTSSAKNETEVELQVTSLSQKRHSDTQVDSGLMAGVISQDLSEFNFDNAKWR